MWLERYLIVGKGSRYSSKGNGTARLTVQRPRLEANEIAIKLALDVPDSLFTKPQLWAKISVPEDAVSKPVIRAETLDNLKEVIEKQLGLDLTITVLEPVDE